MSAPAAEALGEELANAEELADTPTDVGDPYLLLRSLPAAGADTAPPVDTAEYAEEQGELAAVASEPEDRFGEEVVVAGRVTRSAERAFVLEAEGEQLLIVPQSDRGRPYVEGALVQAEGTVERIPADDGPAIVGEDELFQDFEGEPTLAATDITLVDR